MRGHLSGEEGLRTAHHPAVALGGAAGVLDREAREAEEEYFLAPGASRSVGAGSRAIEEPADPWRTCFERDRDRILHSAAFRRLAGKTQVFIFPADHQRTRLTHALEVVQVANAISRACRLNVSLTEAIALGHDCGHGPGGHASEEALSPFLPEGFDHAVWGADVTAAPLNLVRRDLGRDPQPLLVTPVARHARGGGRRARGPDRLLRPRPRGRGSRSDCDERRAPTDRRRALRDHEGPPARRLRDRRRHHDSVLGHGRHQRDDGRGARGSAALQLRAHLSPPSLARPVVLRSSSCCGPSSTTMSRTRRRSGQGAELVTGDQDTLRAAVGYVSGMTDRFACTKAVELFGDRAAALVNAMRPL